jgi:hypothetical protein
VLGGIEIAPACPRAHRGVKRRSAVVDRSHNRRRQRLDLPEGVGDPLPRGRVLEVPGVTYQSPPRAGRLPEEALVLEDPEHLPDPPRAGDRVADRTAGAGVRHERRLAVLAELREKPQLREQDHLKQSAVGGHRDNEPALPAVEDQPGMRTGIGVGEERPVAEPLPRDHVVLSRARFLGHR